MTFNLKLTNKQMGLVISYIFDLCNQNLNKWSKFEDINTIGWDSHDVLRARLHFKLKGMTFYDLDLKEIDFVKSEVTYFVMGGFERSRGEWVSTFHLVSKIEKLKDVSLQRELKLKKLGI